MDWKQYGVKIVHARDLDTNTAQTPGMTRAAAITHARTGATKLWAGTVVVQPHAKTGPHHHGELETVIYVVRGRARLRWGDRLEFWDEADPGDFIYVPPYVPHQEINARADIPCEAVIVRSGQDPVVVNLDIESPEPVSENRSSEKPFHPNPEALVQWVLPPVTNSYDYLHCVGGMISRNTGGQDAFHSVFLDGRSSRTDGVGPTDESANKYS